MWISEGVYSFRPWHRTHSTRNTDQSEDCNPPKEWLSASDYSDMGEGKVVSCLIRFSPQ